MEPNKFKTKIRRLYDVSKVLMTIGIIRQVHLNENKRSALEWIGTDNMKDTINKMLKEGAYLTNVMALLKLWFDKNACTSSNLLEEGSNTEEDTDYNL